MDLERKKPVKITLKSFAVDFIIALGSFEKKQKTKSCSHLMYYSANLDKDDSYQNKKRLKKVFLSLMLCQK